MNDPTSMVGWMPSCWNDEASTAPSRDYVERARIHPLRSHQVVLPVMAGKSRCRVIGMSRCFVYGPRHWRSASGDEMRLVLHLPVLSGTSEEAGLEKTKVFNNEQREQSH